jgi:23S rRNA (guanosine2251-2'-O)-methyltransferase
VEGRRAVRELLAAGRRRVREVWVADGVEPSPLLDEIVSLARSRRAPLRHVPRAELEAAARTEAPQGVLARADPLPEADLEALCVPRGGVAPFLLVLDGVTDPRNAGALLRSAAAAGATGAVLPRHRAAHVTASVAKAAAGAIEHVPMAVVAGVPSALRTLAGHGVWTVGLDPAAPASVFDLELADQAVALVLGAEGPGLSRLVRQRCDLLVAIPQRGAVASLNVAAAGAVACFEVARRRS